MLRFRVDDFPLTKPEEAGRHTLEKFRDFDDVMWEHGPGTYTLACITAHVTGRHVEALDSRRHVRVALHGIRHDESFPNEFRDHQTQADVVQAIVGARELWRGLGYSRDITSYVPPHNVLDARTVRALVSAGFTEVHGGPGSEQFVYDYAQDRGLKTVLVFPPHQYGRSDEMLERGAAPVLREHVASSDDVWVGLHLTWENNVGHDSLKRLFDAVYS